jgi:diadenosine tetraphosphate (Ap4A) HIT family hydrolase
MPDLNPPERGDCPFCDLDRVRNTLLYEAPNFIVIADYAPVHDAHILLSPRRHLPHLAALPPELDAEFEALKGTVGDFVRGQNGGLTFWENGVFGQSVPHAHQHIVSLSLPSSVYEARGPAFAGVDGLRQRYREGPHDTYFTIEQAEGRFLPPDWDLYMRVVVSARETHELWQYRRDGRRERAGPYIEALKQRWQRERPLDGLGLRADAQT